MVFRCLIDRAEVYDKGPLSYKCAWLVGVTCLCLGSERQWACILGAWHHRVFIQKLSSNLPPPFFSLPCLWVTSMHHFRGRGGKRQINKISFQSLYSQRELDEGAAGRWEGGVGGLRPAIENCCPYPERSVYTTCKVKQIDPGCRFTCVFVRLPVNLPACHLQSLFLIRTLPLSLFPPPPLLSHSILSFLPFFSIPVPLQNPPPPPPSLPLLFPYVCLCVYLCFCVYRCVYVSHVPVLRFPTWVPGLDPEKHLGKPLADMELYLKQVTDWWILCLPIFPRHCSTSTYKHMNTISQTGCLMLMYKVI